MLPLSKHLVYFVNKYYIWVFCIDIVLVIKVRSIIIKFTILYKATLITIITIWIIVWTTIYIITILATMITTISSGYACSYSVYTNTFNKNEKKMSKNCDSTFTHSCPSCRVARRAAMKDRNVRRFRASFWMVPQVCCMASSPFLQVFSEGLCEWCCHALSSWRAQSISITYAWWWSPCCLDCSRQVAVD